MRAFVAGLALMALAACGGDSSTTRSSDTVVGTWALKTYNAKPLPFTGSVNENGSVDRVTGGTMAFDASQRYVIGIKITNTLGSTVTQQDFNEVGSYTGTVSTGVTLKRNDVSGGKSTAVFPTVSINVSGNTLSFTEDGKLLTFVRQ